MSEGFFEALTQITRERKVDRDVLVETLSIGMQSAVRRKHGSDAEVEVDIQPQKGTIEVHLVMEVVSEEALDNEDRELTIEEARVYMDDPEVGDVIRIPLDIREFGRNAIMTAKQVLVQGVREAERDRVFNEYSKRVGEIVSGTVQQVDRGNILVNLGRAEALLPYREQIRRERFHQGETIRGLVLEVQRESRGPQIILSRTHQDLLLRLFEQEIPEVYEGLVEVKAIAREPGWRSKVAVFSNDERVDAVGACVGMKGARVMAIVKELSGERIDIVPWDSEISSFVSRALSPAQVSSIKVTDWDSNALEVIVAEDQLSLAIGKEGQNVRLAAKLTGWKIDLVTSELLGLREEADQHIHREITDLDGVTERLAKVLIAAGLETVQDLAYSNRDALQAIDGIGPETATKLLTKAQIMIDELVLEREKYIESRRRALSEERRQEQESFRESLFGEDDGDAASQKEPTLDEKTLFRDLDEEPEEDESDDKEPVVSETEEEPVASNPETDDDISVPQPGGDG
jgi:transcription termination/antitermination protein NusA